MTGALKLALEALGTCGEDEWHSDDDYGMMQVYDDRKVNEAITAIREALAQPAQERQWIWLSDADIADVVDTTCQYTGGYEEYLIKKAERKIRSINNGT